MGVKQALLGMYFAGPVRFVFAGGGFAGRLLDWAARILATTIEIVRKTTLLECVLQVGRVLLDVC